MTNIAKPASRGSTGGLSASPKQQPACSPQPPSPSRSSSQRSSTPAVTFSLSPSLYLLVFISNPSSRSTIRNGHWTLVRNPRLVSFSGVWTTTPWCTYDSTSLYAEQHRMLTYASNSPVYAVSFSILLRSQRQQSSALPTGRLRHRHPPASEHRGFQSTYHLRSWSLTRD